MIVELHADAEPELSSVADWYEARREGLGLAFAAEVRRAGDAIGEAPLTWPTWPGVRPELGVRRFLLARFPFALPYQAQQDRIVVLAIAHTRRRPAYWLRRVKPANP